MTRARLPRQGRGERDRPGRHAKAECIRRNGCVVTESGDCGRSRTTLRWNQAGSGTGSGDLSDSVRCTYFGLYVHLRMNARDERLPRPFKGKRRLLGREIGRIRRRPLPGIAAQGLLHNRHTFRLFAHIDLIPIESLPSPAPCSPIDWRCSAVGAYRRGIGR